MESSRWGRQLWTPQGSNSFHILAMPLLNNLRDEWMKRWTGQHCIIYNALWHISTHNIRSYPINGIQLCGRSSKLFQSNYSNMFLNMHVIMFRDVVSPFTVMPRTGKGLSFSGNRTEYIPSSAMVTSCNFVEKDLLLNRGSRDVLFKTQS